MKRNGRFLRETLRRAGVDTEYLITDKERLTALVLGVGSGYLPADFLRQLRRYGADA